MKYVKLGNSDLTVSRVCMGCMGFGDADNGQYLGRALWDYTQWDKAVVATKFLPQTQEEIEKGITRRRSIKSWMGWIVW